MRGSWGGVIVCIDLMGGSICIRATKIHRITHSRNFLVILQLLAIYCNYIDIYCRPTPYIGYLLEEKKNSNKYPIYFSLGQEGDRSMEGKKYRWLYDFSLS